jgi:hypothetical protein
MKPTITPENLKNFLGPERVARLEKMPVVAERGGLEQHLQAACKDAGTFSQALVKCLRSAGSAATQEDLQRAAEVEREQVGKEEEMESEQLGKEDELVESRSVALGGMPARKKAAK